ncbi:hypothetical protein EES42_37690 [Streptomyces sp. ADI95-17]|nr:hypothetical protein EES42_37690 [Streptomyces sp. ADI95-17]
MHPSPPSWRPRQAHSRAWRAEDDAAHRRRLTPLVGRSLPSSFRTATRPPAAGRSSGRADSCCSNPTRLVPHGAAPSSTSSRQRNRQPGDQHPGPELVASIGTNASSTRWSSPSWFSQVARWSVAGGPTPMPGNGLAVGGGSGPGGKRRFRPAIGLAKRSSRPCLGWRLPRPSAGASHGGSCTWRGARSEYQPGNQGTSRPCPCPGSRRAGHRHWSPGARRERGMTDRKSCRACAPHDATHEFCLSPTYPSCPSIG